MPRPKTRLHFFALSARQRVEKELKVRGGGTEAKSPTSPVTVLKQQLVEKEHKIAHLEERLAAAGAGSLFELKRDNAQTIGNVIVGNVSATKAREIVKAITAALNKATSKPAG